MKKLFKGLLTALLILSLSGCGLISSLQPKEEKLTLTKVLNAGGNIDLENASYAEDAQINTADITVSNAKLGGRTLTVNKPGVTLKNISEANLVIGEAVGDGDVFVENCDFENVTINGGGANSIHIVKTTISRVEVKKESVRVVLEESTKIDDVKVSADNSKIEAAENSNSTIENLEIADNTSGIKIQKVTATTITVKENVKKVEVSDTNVKTIQIEKQVEKIQIKECKVEEAKISNESGTIEVAGGEVEKLKIEKTATTAEIKTVITITKEDTVIKNAEVVVKNGKPTTVEKIAVVVPEDIENVDLPEDIETVTIEDIVFHPKNYIYIKEYKTGNSFDKSGFVIEVIYDNGTSNVIEVPENKIEVKDFSSAKEIDALEVTVSTTYDDKLYETKLTVKISETPDYIANGINLIFSGKYDEGVEKFYEAYKENKTDDKAKLFYSLAKLASLSTDESVSTLLKKNFGLEEYPSTMNALFSTSWLENYKDTDSVRVETFEEATNGSYVRCDINEGNEENEYQIIYILDEDGDWIYATTYEYDGYNTIRSDLRISGTLVPSDNGKYMVYKWSVDNLPEGTKLYDYAGKSKHKTVLSDQIIPLPKLTVPAWVQDTDAYKDSIVKGVTTAETVAVTLFANLLDCNSEGINTLVDDCIKVFDNKTIDEVREIANSINENVLVPEDILSGLNLEEMLGEDPIYIGKAELNVIIAALDIIKGTLQYLSSYDLSMNLSNLRTVFNKMEENKDYSSMYADLITSKTLAVRNENAMVDSKETLLGAIETVIESYDAMFGEEGYYPDAFKDVVKGYGDYFRLGADNLVSALETNSVFYVPKNLSDDWPTTNQGALFGIDLGKMFTPGYFKDLIKKTPEGKAEVYIQAELEYDEWIAIENGDRIDRVKEYTEVLLYTPENQVELDNLINKFRAEHYSGRIQREKGYLINMDIINELVIGLPETQESFILPFENKYESYSYR